MGLHKLLCKTATLISALENGVEGISPQPIQRGKLVKDWKRSRPYVEQINEVSKMENIPVDLLLFNVLNGENEFRGSYIHPLMYDSFMQWLSPKYAVKVAKILKAIHKAANAKILNQLRASVGNLDQNQMVHIPIHWMIRYSLDQALFC